MFWGGLSDRYGRKPIVLLGCASTVLSLLIVGFSQSFTAALLGRVIGGALNGNIGVIQTMVGEIVTRPEHEPKAYSIMPFVWSIGTIIGPAIGGTFADPVKGFPDTFPQDGLFGTYPWLFPNLICAGLMIISIVMAYFFLDETHPDHQTDSNPDVYSEIPEQTPMIIAAGATADPGVDLRQESYGTFNEVEIPHETHWRVRPNGSRASSYCTEKPKPKWCTRKVSMLVAALGIFTYHSMCYDHLLPIFLQDERSDDVSMLATSSSMLHISGGLGLATKSVGLIMSINGIIALFIQAVVFPFAAERLGIWRIFVLVTILHPVAYFIIPYLTLLPPNLVYPGIYTCLTIRNLLSILAYPVLLILLKQASPAPSVLGRINGLAASVGAACRTISPPIAGLLYGWGADIGFTGLAWWGAGAVAFVGVAQLCFVPRERNDRSLVRPTAPFLASTEEALMDVVHVEVIQVMGE